MKSNFKTFEVNLIELLYTKSNRLMPANVSTLLSGMSMPCSLLKIEN